MQFVWAPIPGNAPIWKEVYYSTTTTNRNGRGKSEGLLNRTLGHVPHPRLPSNPRRSRRVRGPEFLRNSPTPAQIPLLLFGLVPWVILKSISCHPKVPQPRLQSIIASGTLRSSGCAKKAKSHDLLGRAEAKRPPRGRGRKGRGG